jgi:ZIP family zinc transporter
MLGWLITVTGRPWSPRVFGITLLVVAAAMITISGVELLPTAVRSGLSVPATAAMVSIGAGIVVVMQLVSRRGQTAGRTLANSAVLIAVAVGLHNVPEGSATAAAALLSVQGGVVTAIAVGLHNIPEGIAVAAPVLAGGGSKVRAFWYTLIATAGEVLGAGLVLVLAETFTETRVAALLALVGGIMITLSILEIAPSGLALLRHRQLVEDAMSNAAR